jgi:hypothetical protein
MTEKEGLKRIADILIAHSQYLSSSAALKDAENIYGELGLEKEFYHVRKLRMKYYFSIGMYKLLLDMVRDIPRERKLVEKYADELIKKSKFKEAAQLYEKIGLKEKAEKAAMRSI